MSPAACQRAVYWLLAAALCAVARAAEDDDLFRREIGPLLERHCVQCHQGPQAKGGLSLVSRGDVLKGGESGPALVPGQPDQSLLLAMVSGEKPEMPQVGERLPRQQVAALRRWIAAGAGWPEGLVLQNRHRDGATWWSLAPLSRPTVPDVKSTWPRTEIDRFILARLEERGLSPSPEADRRTLMRRLYFDLHGLPPPPDEVAAFVSDDDPQAYEKLVDRLLASPRYGERWARHWLDVVHYGDTHGYDKDKLRPHAWPYRDYVIRALNSDLPYGRFVHEQLAADVLAVDTPAAIAALGFIAAGPWDFVGHVELPESKTDGKIARLLDRDDMVMNTISTFMSLTVHCARCHDHKFDPITQRDYYALQAVFAAVDRADRPFNLDPAVQRKRQRLSQRQSELQSQHDRVRALLRERVPELAALEKRIDEARRAGASPRMHEALGYHSQIEARSDVVKWVQIDLGGEHPIERIEVIGSHEVYGGHPGPGFGFPIRFKVELADDAQFQRNVRRLADHTQHDFPHPGDEPVVIDGHGERGRFVRVTATKLWERTKDYIFALGELRIISQPGEVVSRGAEVAALDSIEAGDRWGKRFLVDGLYAARTPATADLKALLAERSRLIDKAAPELAGELAKIETAVQQLTSELAALPPPQMVFAAATDFAPAGGFQPTGGVPRPIHVLARGDVRQPQAAVGPAALACLNHLAGELALPEQHTEGDRRAALAQWITHRHNPLTWRSIVNRVWHYHFGRGIVETPDDFGRMGAWPTHPELLDWLAVEFRDGGQSLKKLHRLMVTSAVYRQSSAGHPAHEKLDAANHLLWRMPRRRLEAEAVRDALLAVSGKLDLTMYGPGFFAFGFKDDHSPHYLYEQADPDDPRTHRRSIYRFIVRSAPDPFLETLDCADPSQMVARRNETLTPLQALALLNNRFSVKMAEHFAGRVEASSPKLPGQIAAAFELALARAPSHRELTALVAYAQQHGLANACRVIVNMNEFLFVD